MDFGEVIETRVGERREEWVLKLNIAEETVIYDLRFRRGNEQTTSQCGDRVRFGGIAQR